MRILAVAAVLLVEVVVIALVYQFVATVDCHETGSQGACRFLRSLVARAIVAFAAFGLFFLARPDAWARLLQLASPPGRRTGVLWGVHLVGVGLILLPAIVGGARNLTDVFHLALMPWLAGLVLAGGTGLALLAPLDALGRWLRAERYAPLIILLVALAVPDVADVILPLWEWQFLTALTFVAVFLTLSLFTPDAQADPEAFILGAEGFFVHIARQCSGLEGIALMTAFVAIYGFLFRRDLRFPQYWLIVLPLGLLLSWLLNVLRIALLVLIGARVSPDLAVNGFHSYAGWLFFTLLALFLLFAVQFLPWVHRRDRVTRPGLSLRDDWLAARILPFIAFMIVGVLTSAVAVHPDLAYPAKTLVLLAALLFFRRQLSKLALSLDPVAIGAGLLVGLGWIVLQPPPGEAEAALMAGSVASPPTTACTVTPPASRGQRLPSTSTWSGRTPRRSTARRMASRLAARMFSASISAASAQATAQAVARAATASASRARAAAPSVLESASPATGRPGSRITAAATTGPASGPRPASSTPATRRPPSRGSVLTTPAPASVPPGAARPPRHGGRPVAATSRAARRTWPGAPAAGPGRPAAGPPRRPCARAWRRPG